MKRAVGSIGANVAEGSGHTSRKEFARFLTYSICSTNELEHHLKLARDVRVIDWRLYSRLSDDIGTIRKMLQGLRKRMSDDCA